MHVNVTNQNPDEVLAKIMRERPDTVTISGAGPDIPRAVELARRVSVEAEYYNGLQTEVYLNTEFVPVGQESVLRLTLKALPPGEREQYRESVEKFHRMMANNRAMVRAR